MQGMAKVAACKLCGRSIGNGRAVTEVFDGSPSCFDSSDCLLIFKKFRALYGKGFFA